MDLGLKDRVAIVAASSQGLGKAVAMGLAKEGARLALCARTEATLEQAAEEIRAATGAPVMARVVDVTQHGEVRGFVGEAAREYGRVDICVANAGGPPAKSFTETTVEDWHRAAALNLMSTVYFAKETLPLMQAQRWGRFIAITSMTVKQPVEGLILSNAVRSGVSSLIKTLANEYGPYNVLVNSVCPGYGDRRGCLSLAERMGEKEGVPRRSRNWARQAPLGRVGRPEEFADAVVFLASERASYITASRLRWTRDRESLY